MGIRFPLSLIPSAKQILKMQLGLTKKLSDVVPRDHVAVYVGYVKRKRFVVPVSYLNHPAFQRLLNRVEEEFGYHHQHGGLSLTIPCNEDIFIDLTSRLQYSWYMKMMEHINHFWHIFFSQLVLFLVPVWMLCRNTISSILECKWVPLLVNS